MNIKFKPIGGATWILQVDNLKIACDPVLCSKGTLQDFFWFKSKRIEEPIFKDNDFENIDLWLLTHKHEDHLDKLGKEKIDKTTKLIIHKNLKTTLKEYNYNILKHRQIHKFKIKDTQIEIEAIKAVHGVNPISALVAGGVNGYWLTIIKASEKIEIYISGDTVYKSSIAKILRGRKANIYIPNMGGASKGTIFGTLTMTAKMLKKYIKIINPEIILPVHFGTFSHYNEPIKKVEKLNNNKIHIIKVGEISIKKI